MHDVVVKAGVRVHASHVELNPFHDLGLDVRRTDVLSKGRCRLRRLEDFAALHEAA